MFKSKQKFAQVKILSLASRRSCLKESEDGITWSLALNEQQEVRKEGVAIIKI